MKDWLPRFLIYWVINVAVLWAASVLIGVVRFDTMTALLKAGIWLAVANSFFKPVLVLLTLPITILTLGLFLIVLNVLLLFFVEWMVADMHLGGFWRTALLSVFVSLGSMLLNALIKPPTDF